MPSNSESLFIMIWLMTDFSASVELAIMLSQNPISAA